jgi:glutathione synthase/RimK-type ligase-like ATP-grasp enzyme
MVQPFEYQILFNDKVVCEQLCKGMGINQVESIGVLNKDNDYRNELINIFAVSGVDKLIVKPILGHGGSGIVLAQKKLDEVTVNMKQGLVPLKDFILKENAIVQKLLQQNSIISKISSSSLNTIRVVTILKKSGSVQIVSATMRFGVGVSFVDNYSSGGIAAGINCKTGKLKKYAHSKIGERYTHHPTSGFEFEGFQISSWNFVIELAQEVQKQCPFYKLLGMDIAIDNERKPILIEVNANPDIIFQEQTSGPLFADRDVLQSVRRTWPTPGTRKTFAFAFRKRCATF